VIIVLDVVNLCSLVIISVTPAIVCIFQMLFMNEREREREREREHFETKKNHIEKR
jgi:hypothetical protein